MIVIQWAQPAERVILLPDSVSVKPASPDWLAIVVLKAINNPDHQSSRASVSFYPNSYSPSLLISLTLITSGIVLSVSLTHDSWILFFWFPTEIPQTNEINFEDGNSEESSTSQESGMFIFYFDRWFFVLDLKTICMLIVNINNNFFIWFYLAIL